MTSMKKFVLLALTTAVLSAKAQDPKVVVFNSSSDNKPAYLEKHNLIKFNVIEAFAGDFAFYYERIMADKLSLEAGLGVTLSDYFSTFYNSDFTFDFADDSVEPLLGFSFALGGRYYPFRAADEFYFAPEFKFKNYKNNRYYTDNNNVEQVVLESTRWVVPRISFGYVYFFDDNIFVDYFAGFGIGSVTSNQLEQSYNGVTGLWEYEIESKRRLVPRFHIGVKIGVAI